MEFHCPISARLASGARRLRRVALQAIVSRVTAEISLARSHMPC